MYSCNVYFECTRSKFDYITDDKLQKTSNQLHTSLSKPSILLAEERLVCRDRGHSRLTLLRVTHPTVQPH